MVTKTERDDEPKHNEEGNRTDTVGHLRMALFFDHAGAEQGGRDSGRDGAEQGAEKEGAMFDVGDTEEGVGQKTRHGQDTEQDDGFVTALVEVSGQSPHARPLPGDP